MRLLSADITLLVLTAYWLLTAGAWLGLRPLLRTRSPLFHRRSLLFWITEASLMTTGLVGLHLARLPLADPLRHTLFFTFNGLLMADMAIKLPAMTALLLHPFFRHKRPRIILSSMAAVLMTGLLGVFTWGFAVGPRLPLVRELHLTLPALPPAFDGYRITQLSDLHLGSFHSRGMLRRLAVRSGRFSPDAVVFTGDLVNDQAIAAPHILAILRGFRGYDGQWAIAGNHDYGDYSRWPSVEARENNLEAIRKCFRDGGFHLLENSHQVVVRDGDSLVFVGVGNHGDSPLPRHDDLEAAGRGLGTTAFRILLSHDPAHWEKEVRHDPRYPLTLAGHTHGLQWGISLAGMRFSLSQAIRKQWAGLHREQEQFLYVNSGLGLIGMLFRIDMPPELTLITLHAPQASTDSTKR